MIGFGRGPCGLIIQGHLVLWNANNYNSTLLEPFLLFAQFCPRNILLRLLLTCSAFLTRLDLLRIFLLLDSIAGGCEAGQMPNDIIDPYDDQDQVQNIIRA